MSVRIHQLQSFITTAQCGSFTAAAEKLYITPPALIQQMNTLEKSLGLTLFIRNHQGVQLTESGQLFYDKIVVICQEYESLLQTCRQIEGKSDTIRVGSYGFWYREYVFLGLLTAFSSVHENIALKYFTTTPEKALLDCKNKELDVCLCTDPDAAKALQLRYTQMHTDKLCLLMTEKHPFIKKERITKEDLIGQTIFMDVCFYGGPFKQWFQNEQEIHIKTMYYTIEEVLRKCNKGHLVCIPLKTAQFLRPLHNRILDIPVEYSFGVVTRKNTSATIQTFVDFVTHHYD